MSESIFEAQYKKLNREQQKAVDSIYGPLLVVAGPGTGKTELLALRVANILRIADASPSNILCLSFTENGVLNMRERLLRYIGNDAYRVNIFTFHGFCNMVISRFPEYFFHSAAFSQATDLDRAELAERLFSQLPHGHPLATTHPQEGFIYKRDVIERIRHIKSGGYTPKEYAAVIDRLLQEHAAVDEVLASWPEGRASMKSIEALSEIVTMLNKTNTVTGAHLAATLRAAIADATIIGKTEPVSRWKRKYTVKEEEKLHFKDAAQKDKIIAVAELYERYQSMLYESALYDYEDTIIEVTHALDAHVTLRQELEEQYQFVLVDEFQDTNEAQMKLVHAITSNPIHEGRPNVMVVGDDDQAVYKFQGAEISNIIEFRDKGYRNVETIVLDTNYRSHQVILSLARSVVEQGTERLERRYSDITKQLRQGDPSLAMHPPIVRQLSSDVEEYMFVQTEIQKLHAYGTKWSNIAVIARNHRELQAFIPFLERAQIPYQYQKRSNVFDMPHIQELITIAEYLASINDATSRHSHLLPTILSYPYFKIERNELFRIAIEAKDARASWEKVIQDSKVPEIAAVSSLLAELSASVEREPLEHVLDRYMTLSGFREYYFGKAALKEDSNMYVEFLSVLKTFIDALREWNMGKPIFCSDMAQFVAIHQQARLTLSADSYRAHGEESVQLLTAHAAKGLEFDTVFVISAHDRLWTRGQRANKASIPSPLLPIIHPAGDEDDDFIRLFYVALTRAKTRLYVTGHDGLIRYLKHDATTATQEESVEASEEGYEDALRLFVAPPYSAKEETSLRSVVKDYRMPVTHLSNFLDIVHGGPQYFIEQNLLRFPQPMNVSAVYGSAMHAAIEECISHPRYHGGEQATLEHILGTFKRELSRGRLSLVEEEKQTTRATPILAHYQKRSSELFSPDDMLEVDFAHEGIAVGNALLAGKIDVLRKDATGYQVIDLKTGKEFHSWEEKGKSDSEKMKLHKYKQQLVFYSILLEHASRFSSPAGKLSLLFVESITLQDAPVELVHQVSREEQTRLEKLIQVVYRRIQSLDFPDVSTYELNYNGILQFEEDLISQYDTIITANA